MTNKILVIGALGMILTFACAADAAARTGAPRAAGTVRPSGQAAGKAQALRPAPATPKTALKIARPAASKPLAVPKLRVANLADKSKTPFAGASTNPPRASAAGAAKKPVAAKSRPAPGDFVVAIDAGHGGKDVGATGPGGIREKDVVLAIANRLAALILSTPGMRPTMVRKGDEFIDLSERARIARKARADLFVSLHADAYVNGEAKGSSVFTLSRHGASNMAARWLADKENSADTVGGVRLHDKDRLLASVLLDLSQNAAIEASDRAAARILGELSKRRPLHHREVQKAGFAVLKSPDTPSLLIETGFISNPEEERQLANPAHQQRVAAAIFNGIRAFFDARRGKRPSAREPAGVVVAQP